MGENGTIVQKHVNATEKRMSKRQLVFKKQLNVLGVESYDLHVAFRNKCCLALRVQYAL